MPRALANCVSWRLRVATPFASWNVSVKNATLGRESKTTGFRRRCLHRYSNTMPCLSKYWRRRQELNLRITALQAAALSHFATAPDKEI